MRNMLEAKVPEPARAYALQLWTTKPFEMAITAPRKSKYGDFRMREGEAYPLITVNAGLPPYRFLLTYVHEVAHWYTYAGYGKNVAPHGREWKMTFQKLMIPLLHKDIIPHPLLQVLVHHMVSPKASAGGDPRLEQAFRALEQPAASPSLLELPTGAEFKLNGRLFRKESTRRTRALCCEVKSGKKYLVPLAILVEPK